MELDNLTFGQLKEIQNLLGTSNQEKHPYTIGQNYLVRTVTMIYTGKLVEVYKNELVFINCAWIPETARWMNTVKNGELNEVEPYNFDDKVIVGRGAILDICPWHKELPKEQK